MKGRKWRLTFNRMRAAPKRSICAPPDWQFTPIWAAEVTTPPCFFGERAQHAHTSQDADVGQLLQSPAGVAAAANSATADRISRGRWENPNSRVSREKSQRESAPARTGRWPLPRRIECNH